MTQKEIIQFQELTIKRQNEMIELLKKENDKNWDNGFNQGWKDAMYETGH